MQRICKSISNADVNAKTKADVNANTKANVNEPASANVNANVRSKFTFDKKFTLIQNSRSQYLRPL